MVEWRDRGFVQDSDQEDEAEISSLDSQDHGHDIANHISAFASGDTAIAVTRPPNRNVKIAVVVPGRSEAGSGRKEIQNETGGHLTAAGVHKSLARTTGNSSETRSFQESNIIESQDTLEDGRPQSVYKAQVLPSAAKWKTCRTATSQPASLSVLKATKGRISDAYGDIFDIPSSPLSDAPASPDTGVDRTILRSPKPSTSHSNIFSPASSIMQRSPTPMINGSSSSLPGNLHLAQSSQLDMQPTDSPAQETNAKRRTFRPRNPIQLHPYLLENEQYRNTLRARGIRPVIVAGPQLPQARPAESESQDVLTTGRSSPFEPSSPSTLSSSPLMPAISEAQMQYQHEVDKMDISSPHSTVHDLDEVTEQPTSRKAAVSGRATTQSTDLRGRIGQHTYHSTNSATANSLPLHPPTHPATGRITKKYRMKKFKMPTGFIQAQLPTPETSSEAGVQEQAVHISFTDTETEPEANPVLDLLYVDREMSSVPKKTRTRTLSPAARDESQDSDEAEQIRAAQRRIRGVLPASYLTLNQRVREQTERKLKQRSLLPASGSKDVNTRGVARRIENNVTRIEPNGLTPGTYFEISDDSDDTLADTDTALLRPAISSLEDWHKKPTNHGRRHMNSGDVVEEDWVDPMAPDVTRRRLKNSIGKTQLRLEEGFRNAKLVPAVLDDVTEPTHSVRQKRHRTDRARRKHPAKRSVLDSESFVVAGPKPDFLKVAVRQARSHADGGRHRPLNKVISFHDARDEAEMQATLNEWRKDYTTNVTNDRAHLRKPTLRRVPFGEVSHNQQQRFPDPVTLATPTMSLPRNTKKGRLSSTFTKPPPRLHQTKLGLETTRRTHAHTPSSIANPQPSAKGISRSTRNIRNSLGQHHLRPGQLEGLEVEHDINHHETAFQRDLLTLDVGFDKTQKYHQRTSNPLLGQFLGAESENRIQDVLKTRSEIEISEVQQLPDLSRQHAPIKHRFWKRRPQRTNVDDFDIDIDIAPLPGTLVIDPTTSLPKPKVINSCDALKGLGKFGTFYTADFEVRHLAVGTYFHSGTFIGSGELQSALALDQRDLEQSVASISLNLGTLHVRWGGWTDEVSSQLSNVFKEIQLELEHRLSSPIEGVAVFPDDQSLRPIATLRSIIQYFTHHFHFLDAVDRRSFTERMVQDLEHLLQGLHLAREGSNNTQQPRTQSYECLHVRQLTYLVVILYQVWSISKASSAKTHTASVEKLLCSAVRLLLDILFVHNVRRIWTFSSAAQQRLVQQSGIKDEHYEVECITVLSHILPKLGLAGFDFWHALEFVLAQRPLNKYLDVADFDNTWHDIFSVLPLLEFDVAGVLRPRNRLDALNGHWTIIKVMLSRLFELYMGGGGESETTVNSYIRATLRRCFNLVCTWDWGNAEVILNCIFDFFARNGLSLLRYEDSKGSPAFITNLENAASVEIGASDRSFDIFLKILHVCLRHSSLCYPIKKMKSIAWRFIPNSGCLLEKEKELHYHDLNTRRNHHDLLCVLYAALPPGARPSIDLLIGLVDFVSTHSEICRINIRSWANLTRFQLSTDESQQSVDPFAVWYNKFLLEMTQQHRNARFEAENQFEASRISGEIVSSEFLETTIAGNQKQTEGLLIMALTAMRDCIKDGQNSALVLRLFEAINLKSILEMFNPRCMRLNKVIVITLEVYDAFMIRLEQSGDAGILPRSDEDSQEFGDWSALEGAIDDEMETDAHAITQKIGIQLQTTLSNCFGLESFFDEVLLSKLTDTWSRLCQIFAKSGRRDWSYYLDQHSPGSWQQLRNTEQSRKYFPYFMSSILSKGGAFHRAFQGTFFAAWMVSLVERESMLKFQGRFTAALLNAYPQHPLLVNLPFEHNSRTQILDVDLSQLRERRLGLISSVLANMRHTFESNFLQSANEAQQIRVEYGSILRQFMNAMRNNFQDTQQGSSTRGAYVEFTQKVIELLQQYTNDLCPVDPFFTDSAAFPLPTSDPTYVVGRLKSYSFGLSDTRIQKKLAIFIQSLCERAVVENQSGYFVDQLRNAVGGTHEQGAAWTPSLRSMLIRAILPAYLESVPGSDCGWILADILLDATMYIFDEIVLYFNITDQTSRNITLLIVTDFLETAVLTVYYLARDLNHLAASHILHMLNSIFRTVTRTTSIVDCIHRYSQEAEEAVGLIANLSSLGNMLLQQPSNQLPGASAFPCEMNSTSGKKTAFEELKVFCKRELEASLHKNWVKHDDSYYILRGSSRKELVIDLGTVEEEMCDMKGAIAEFYGAVGRMPAFNGMLRPSEEPALSLRGFFL